MGFSITISASIVFIALLIAFVTLSGAFLSTLSSLTYAINARSSLDYKHLSSSVKIDNAFLNSSTTLIFNVTNTGSVKIWDFEHCNVIVSYLGNNTLSNTTIKVICSLNYTSSSPGPGEWHVSQIFDDLKDPGIINSGETAMIVANLTYQVIYNETFTVVFSTSHGATYEFSFITSEGAG